MSGNPVGTDHEEAPPSPIATLLGCHGNSAGRMVVPKTARDELGLMPGTELELHVVDRRIEIEIPPTPMRLDEHGVVAVADREMPVLTADTVRDPLERVRR